LTIGRILCFPTLYCVRYMAREANPLISAMSSTAAELEAAASLLQVAAAVPPPKTTPPPKVEPTTKPAPKKRGRKAKPKTQQRKKKATDGSRSPPRSDADEADADAVENGYSDPGATDDEGSDDAVYCICRGRDDHTPMIQCDVCDEWFHLVCIKVEKWQADLIDKFVCEKCFIDGKLATSWKRTCRTKGCKRPANLPSKWCRDSCRLEWGRDMVALLRDGDRPSKGGELSKGELKSMLLFCNGDLEVFKSMGQKPELPTDVEINYDEVMTHEEKLRIAEITTQREIADKHVTIQTDRRDFMKWAQDRIKELASQNKDLVGTCGWDRRIAYNDEEWTAWRDFDAGIATFKQKKITEGDYCEEKKCKGHARWFQTHMTDAGNEIGQRRKEVEKLAKEEEAIFGRVRTREAAKIR
jgi:hypothetical protein